MLRGMGTESEGDRNCVPSLTTAPEEPIVHKYRTAHTQHSYALSLRLTCIALSFIRQGSSCIFICDGGTQSEDRFAPPLRPPAAGLPSAKGAHLAVLRPRRRECLDSRAARWARAGEGLLASTLGNFASPSRYWMSIISDVTSLAMSQRTSKASTALATTEASDVTTTCS